MNEESNNHGIAKVYIYVFDATQLAFADTVDANMLPQAFAPSRGEIIRSVF
jgi:hypothetical protein